MQTEQRVLNGRYRLLQPIGHGGMAQVYEGEDTLLGRPVAVKMLAPQYARDEDFVRRFRREAQAAARLNHPGVVAVFDTGSDGDGHYIVMELVRGQTLADLLAAEGALEPERAAEIALAVAGGLQFAHENGIVHRDVKPANIMLTQSGEVKVMDFGIARALSSETITQTATVLGTAAYLSPEQAQGERLDARTDVYSLGCVLFQMLTGQPPFTGETPVAVAYKHVSQDPEPPSALVAGLPPTLDAIALRALAKEPERRYGSAGEMAEDLARFLRGEQTTAAVPASEGPATAVLDPSDETAVLAPAAASTAEFAEEEAPTRRRRGRGVVIAIVAGVVLALALIGLAASRVVNGGDTPGTVVPGGGLPGRGTVPSVSAPAQDASPDDNGGTGTGGGTSPSPSASPSPSPSATSSPTTSPSASATTTPTTTAPATTAPPTGDSTSPAGDGGGSPSAPASASAAAPLESSAAPG